MAYRALAVNASRRLLVRPLLKSPSHAKGSIRHSSIFVEPSVQWLEKPSCVFSWPALKHHWGALPVVIISAIGFAVELLAILRIAVTRDDVWFTNGSAACDYIETRAGYQAPCRKFKHYNYKNPPGLVEALQGDVNGPPSEPEPDKNKKKK